MIAKICLNFTLIAACLVSPMNLPLLQAGDIKKYTVGVEDYRNFLPYSSYKDGLYEGLGKDILDLFAKQKGFIFIYRVYPLKRRDQLFVEGRFDFSFPDNPRWVMELKKGLDIKYTPMLEFTDGVLVLPENKGKGIERIKRLGIPLGFTPWQYLGLIREKRLIVDESGNFDGLYKKLILGRVDGVYSNVKIAEYYFSQVEGITQFPIVFDPGLPHAKGYWYLSTIEHPQILDQFKKFIDENKVVISDLKALYHFN